MDVIDHRDEQTEMRAIRASFMRGGTSKGLFFRWEDVPEDRDAFLCAAIGSPDPNGRQLDGMGGGISSLSKAMMVRRSERDGVDVDYLFGQVAIGRAEVDYSGNCGNLTAAVGVFAVNEGLVQLPDGEGVVRMFNENTAKRIDCRLVVRNGRAAVTGDTAIAGVAGTGSAIRLDFLAPARTRSSHLVIEGQTDGIGWSFVDAANPCVFVPAAAFGLSATEMPDEIAAMGDVLDRLDVIRRAAGVAAGLAEAAGEIADAVPKVALVGPPNASRTLARETIAEEDCDLQLRMISMGQPHLAVPLTGAMATATAARLPGTVVAECARPTALDEPVRIATASGVVPAMAQVEGGEVPRASVFRTARLLMEGVVHAVC